MANWQRMNKQTSTTPPVPPDPSHPTQPSVIKFDENFSVANKHEQLLIVKEAVCKKVPIFSC